MKIRLLGATALIAAAAAAGCATSPGYGGGSYNNGNNGGYNDGYGNNNGGYGNNTACYDCGTIIRIETAGGGKAAPNATGAVLGGIIGAAAGHEITDKTGGSKGKQNTAAVAGAVAGALAGNAIQNNVQARNVYTVYVRMDDGRTSTVTQDNVSDLREGTAVRVVNGRAVRR